MLATAWGKLFIPVNGILTIQGNHKENMRFSSPEVIRGNAEGRIWPSEAVSGLQQR
jgi:hypothetical protein